jgi:hypothetical protein
MEFMSTRPARPSRPTQRPIVIITSNNEKELPDAFLRRCFFHFIKFPDAETMRDIIEVHFPGLKGRLVNEALNIFYQVRDVPGLKKKPSTSELLDWIKLLLNEDVTPETLREKDPTKAIPPPACCTWPCSARLLPVAKNEQDVSGAVHLFPERTSRCQRQTWPCLPARCGCPCRQCSSRAAFHTDAELSFDCAAVPLFQYLDALTERAQPANVGEPQPVSRHICKLGRFRQLKSSITASAHFFEHKLL